MTIPAKFDIRADRWVTLLEPISFLNYDFTGAAFAMEVRAVPDATGSALISLTTAANATAQGVYMQYSGSDTVANHIGVKRLASVPAGMSLTDNLQLTVLQIRINETTMEGLPFPQERGDDLELAYDLHITPSGGVKQKYLEGKFVVKPGATQ